MPSLQPLPKTERIYLPSTNKPEVLEADRAWVEVKDAYGLGDISAISAMVTGTKDLILAGIVCMITAWNLTDPGKEDTIAPINMQTVNRMHPDDFPLLSERFHALYNNEGTEVTADEKKESSVTSTVTDQPNPTSQTITPPLS
jgi:hypothetical protein